MHTNYMQESPIKLPQLQKKGTFNQHVSFNTVLLVNCICHHRTLIVRLWIIFIYFFILLFRGSANLIKIISLIS